MSRQRDQQRVLDIVVERIAVSDAFEREAARRSARSPPAASATRTGGA